MKNSPHLQFIEFLKKYLGFKAYLNFIGVKPFLTQEFKNTLTKY